MRKIASMYLFEGFVTPFRKVENEEDVTALRVYIAREGFKKLLKKYLKQKGLRFEEKSIDETIRYLEVYPTFSYMLTHSKDLYNFLEEMQFKVLEFNCKNPIDLQNYINLKYEFDSLGNYLSNPILSKQDICFDVTVEMPEEDLWKLKAEIEKLVVSPIFEWFDENWGMVSSKLEDNQNEIEAKRAARRSKKDRVAETGILGYLAVDNWNKPVRFSFNREELTNVGKKIYIIVNDGSIENGSLGG